MVHKNEEGTQLIALGGWSCCCQVLSPLPSPFAARLPLLLFCFTANLSTLAVSNCRLLPACYMVKKEVLSRPLVMC